MINGVAGANKNSVAVLIGGSAVTAEEWKDRVSAILMAWYPGMGGGTALARILFGEVNPSGKLPFTLPVNASDLPYFDSQADEIEYGYYHGYTLFDRKGLKGREKKLPEEVARIIERHEAHDRVLAASFSDATIRRFREIMPEVASCGAIRKSLSFYLLSHLGLAGWIDWNFDGLFIMPSYGPLPVYTDTLATAARASGLHIYLWTINEEEDMLDFLQAEVNGILSDYPSVLYEVVASTRENDR